MNMSNPVQQPEFKAIVWRKALFKPAAALIVALHFFGLLGMHWPVMDESLQKLTPFASFLSLTPLNLLLNISLLLLFHDGWNRSFGIFALVSFMVGYWVEVAGVATGAIFGSYAYGDVLGLKVLDVPLLIGVNWLLLTYCSSQMIGRFVKHPLAGAAVAAALMVLLDVLIEPVAIYFDFWQWETENVPLQNYLAWYIVAFGLCYLYFKGSFSKANPIAPIILVAQFLFFALQLLLIMISQ